MPSNVIGCGIINFRNIWSIQVCTVDDVVAEILLSIVRRLCTLKFRGISHKINNTLN